MAKAHQLDYQLVGDDMQAVIVTLDPREAIQAEAGAMMFLEEGIRVNTGTGGLFRRGGPFLRHPHRTRSGVPADTALLPPGRSGDRRLRRQPRREPRRRISPGFERSDRGGPGLLGYLIRSSTWPQSPP
jgi:hypothetical protein